jgi:hypothetical protein
MDWIVVAEEEEEPWVVLQKPDARAERGRKRPGKRKPKRGKKHRPRFG